MSRSIWFVPLVLTVICLAIASTNVQMAKADWTNDNFVDATPITVPFSPGTSVDYIEYNSDHSSTLEEGEPTPTCASDLGSLTNTSWYKITATEATNMLFYIYADYGYSVVGIFEGDSLASLQQIDCQILNRFNWFNFQMDQGEVLYIQLGWINPPEGWRMDLQLTFYGPLENDTLAGATVLPGTGGTIFFNNVSATMDAQEPVPSCVLGNNPGKTLWYTFTSEGNGYYYFNFGGSSLFAAFYDNAGNEVDCIQEAGDRIKHFTPGVPYYIQIGGINAASGIFRLDLWKLPPPPANDNFADAQIIDPISLPTNYSIDNAGITPEATDPYPTCAPEGNTYYTMWYSLQPLEPFALITELPYYSNATMAVYEQQDNSLLEVGCNQFSPESPRMDASLEAGKQYYIMYANTGTPVYDSINFRASPANDNMAHPRRVTLQPERTTITIDNTNATVEADEPYQSCLGYVPGNTLWYEFTPDKSTSLWFDYNNSYWPEPNVAVYEKTETGLIPVGCQNQYQYRVKISVEDGKTYLIQFGSLYYSYGITYELNINFPTLNDNFDKAIPISGAVSGMSVNIQYSGIEQGEPDPGFVIPCQWCSSTPVGQTVWYQFTTPVTKSYQILAQSANIYTGSWDALTKVLSWPVTDWYGNVSSHVFVAEQGKTYYIQLGASGDNTGPLAFSINDSPGFSINSSFYFPDSPTIYDDTNLCVGWVNDPLGIPIQNYSWDFGDGTSSQTDQSCAVHRYTTDANPYTATVVVTTQDGRTASATLSVPVITRNVTITKFTLPDNVRVGQTRPVHVYLANTSRYNETVRVELYRSTPTGYVKFGELIQEVAITPLNQPVRFAFTYTFTQADAAAGKVTFQAVATIVEYDGYSMYFGERDALPGDNTALSAPVRVR